MNEIAIVGIGCLFPGAESPEEFWQMLMSGNDVTSEVTIADMGRSPSIYHSPKRGIPDKISYTKNGYIRDFNFDPYGYKVHPEKLIALDRIFHWSLYAAREALRDSGYLNNEEVLNKSGLILGNLSFATEHSSKLFSSMHLKTLEYFVKELLNYQDFRFNDPTLGLNISPDNAITASLPASIVCSGLGLGGIRYAIDSACSSSLYVMELASYYLNTGQVDMMLAGAVCGSERLNIIHGFNVLNAFPDQGNSAPFDQSSEGIKIGEGVGMFVLKRLSDAEKNGDRIYAVIENIGLSNDGGGKHILSPSKKGQHLALKRAYQGSEPVDYIECHATGTSLGDQTELNSIEEFFATKDKIPLLGANKAHTGHMLTASAMASMIKVIWAMKEGVIPATIGVENAIATQNGIITSASIVCEHTPWPQTNKPKRAGINAFGFGGTNAHLILREYSPASTQSTSLVPKPNQSKPSIPAIVGMHIHIGAVEGLEAFANTLFENREVMESLPSERWSGAEETLTEAPPKAAYLDKFALDCIAFKIPPKEVGSVLFDHLFMMKVADVALRDAGFTRHQDFSNTAVIIATEMNLTVHRNITRLNMPWHLRECFQKFNIQLTDDQVNQLESVLKDSMSPCLYVEGVTGGIGNLVASRIAALWDFTGPAFTVSAQESSVYKAIEIAKFLLDFGTVDAVVVGAIDQAASWENVELRKQLNQHNSQLTFGEGAGAIVLKRKEDAQKSQDKIYATIESLAIIQGNGNEVVSDCVWQATRKSLATAEVNPNEVGYIELNEGGIFAQDKDEKVGLNTLYSLEHTNVGSVKENVGNSFVLSGMASIIKTSLCLYHRFIPVYQQQSVQSWQLSSQQNKRFGAVNMISNDYSYTHLILGEGDYQEIQQNPQFAHQTESKKGVFKTLLNGSARMRDLILSDDNIKQFSTVKIPKVVKLTPERALSDNYSMGMQPIMRDRKQIILEKQYLWNAKLQNLFLQIQDAFYEKVSSSLTTNIDKAKSENLDPEFLPAASHQTIATLPSTPTNDNQIIHEPKNIIWNLAEITEIVDGKISNVLGSYYQEMDKRPIRTRTPSPPFMFISRVTKMTAERGKLQPCMVEWEYDIPPDTFYAAHNTLSGLMILEASHAMLLALAYIGCDMMFDGQLRYRALSCQSECLDEFPPPGETIRGEVYIHKLIKAKNNLLLQYEYICYHKNRPLVRLNANSGYFSDADINNSKGLPAYNASPRQTIVKQNFLPPLTCHKTKFNDEDIQALQKGNFNICFGDAYQPQKPYALASDKLLMINRILHVDPQGGAWGLGQVLGEVDIDPEHWVFNAHFKNDPVMPGTMLIEGCYQVVFFYMYYLGLHTKFNNCKPVFFSSLKSSTKFRGEVKREKNQVQFRVTVKELVNADEPYLIAVTEVIYNDRIIGICDDLYIKLVERQN
ncbi:hypothetical protein FNW02_24370 [Komarekiella sp. 'clone 1']|uniref:Ketosynthase family 3 (KS3) domain-containing protein n=1 Tax=Komarekiella delphini-convector SJRDD-AB1 TaxID=2593771 RepID=A0AA40T0S6_9NOST|nr:beta-ketoacyl synthase N-terminal-like domain-containing protein [Komarekiella delphini-convector]MBD6618874.1 hypothetical protein [Komarekiella delphini-convector SJRDD-AB1]